MDKILEVVTSFEPVFSAIITGIITFIITKYTYHRNRPLDKLEITYNRVYYPVYRLLKSYGSYNSDFINNCGFYLEKYHKYVDNTTLIAYKALKDTPNKNTYANFAENIRSENSYLRIQLGYLESNSFKVFKYIPSKEKFKIIFCFEVILMYSSLMLYGIITIQIVRNVLSFIGVLSIISLPITIIIYLAMKIFSRK